MAYATDPNGTRAARRAGYAESCAASAASRLRRHPEVVRLVAEHRRTAAAELGLHGRATIDDARAGAVLSVSDYWVLEYLPPELPGEPPRAALRLKRGEELSYAERAALSAESFDEDGDLVAIVLRESTPAIVELGRRAGVPGFDERPEPSD